MFSLYLNRENIYSQLYAIGALNTAAVRQSCRLTDVGRHSALHLTLHRGWTGEIEMQRGKILFLARAEPGLVQF